MKVAVLGVVPPKADRSASGPDATSALPPGPLVWYDQVTLPELGASVCRTWHTIATSEGS